MHCFCRGVAAATMAWRPSGLPATFQILIQSQRWWIRSSSASAQSNLAQQCRFQVGRPQCVFRHHGKVFASRMAKNHVCQCRRHVPGCAGGRRPNAKAGNRRQHHPDGVDIRLYRPTSESTKARSTSTAKSAILRSTQPPRQPLSG